MYICDFSRAVGVGSATTRNTRGLTRSTIRLMVPPLPAVSRPSNTTQTFAPVALTHSCMATSSPCSVASSASYSRRRSFAPGSAAPAAIPAADFFFFFLPIFDISSGQVTGTGSAAQRGVCALWRDYVWHIDRNRGRRRRATADPLADFDDEREDQCQADALQPLEAGERRGQQARL